MTKPANSAPDGDPFDSPQWREFADRVIADALPKIRDSAIVAQFVPDEPDVKIAVELGFSILLDKPLILVVPPGRVVPEHLVRAADRIVEGQPSDPTVAQRITQAIRELLPDNPGDEDDGL